MNRTTKIAGLLVLTLVFAAQPASAQKNENVGLEIRVKKETFVHKANVPILSRKPIGPKGEPSDVYIGSWATVDCVDCPLSSEYSIFGQAVRIENDQVELIFEVDFKNRKKCNPKMKVLRIQRDKPLRVNKKCGVEISIAYPMPTDLVK